MLVKFECEEVKELFEVSGKLLEVLGTDAACGKCNSVQIFPRLRTAGEYSYYEIVCGDCGAKLSFGQHKKTGTIWPKRAEKDGTPIPNRGWVKYAAIAPPQDDADQHESNPPARTPPAPAATAQRVPDPPELVAMLSDPMQLEQVKRDLFFGIVEALGEKNGNDPKSRAAWNQVNQGNPTDKDVIRRLFHFKTGGR